MERERMTEKMVYLQGHTLSVVLAEEDGMSGLLLNFKRVVGDYLERTLKRNI